MVQALDWGRDHGELRGDRNGRSGADRGVRAVHAGGSYPRADRDRLLPVGGVDSHGSRPVPDALRRRHAGGPRLLFGQARRPVPRRVRGPVSIWGEPGARGGGGAAGVAGRAIARPEESTGGAAAARISPPVIPSEARDLLYGNRP